jgi:hypothetical protein
MNRQCNWGVTVLASLVPVAGCSLIGLAGERGRMEESRERWQQQGITTYEMKQDNLCSCPKEVRGPALITVRDGVVVSRVLIEDELPVPPSAEASFGTVDDLFSRIEQALDQDFDLVMADYDPQLGYPRRIFLDPDDDAADDDLGITVILVPLR